MNFLGKHILNNKARTCFATKVGPHALSLPRSLGDYEIFRLDRSYPTCWMKSNRLRSFSPKHYRARRQVKPALRLRGAKSWEFRARPQPGSSLHFDSLPCRAKSSVKVFGESAGSLEVPSGFLHWPPLYRPSVFRPSDQLKEVFHCRHKSLLLRNQPYLRHELYMQTDRVPQSKVNSSRRKFCLSSLLGPICLRPAKVFHHLYQHFTSSA